MKTCTLLLLLILIFVLPPANTKTLPGKVVVVIQKGSKDGQVRGQFALPVNMWLAGQVDGLKPGEGLVCSVHKMDPGDKEIITKPDVVTTDWMLKCAGNRDLYPAKLIIATQ